MNSRNNSPSYENDLFQWPTPPRSLGLSTNLPDVPFCKIMTFLTTEDIKRLALTSKCFSRVVMKWIDSIASDRLFPYFWSCAELRWTPPALICDRRLPDLAPLFPEDFRLNCILISELFKSLTYFFDTHCRLLIFKDFVDKMGKKIQRKIKGYKIANLIIAVSSIILQNLISGCDPNERVRIFAYLSQIYDFKQMLDRFLESPIGSSSRRDLCLRILLRTLFIDFSDYKDEAIWRSILFDSKKGSLKLAKLFILLYALIRWHRQINWNFIDEDPTCSSCHSYSYQMLGTVIKRLLNQPHGLLTMLTTSPRDWGYRAKAALLVYLQKSWGKKETGRQQILQYFQRLSSSRNTNAAVGILVEIRNISRRRCQYSLRHPCMCIVWHARQFDMDPLIYECGWRRPEVKLIEYRLGIF